MPLYEYECEKCQKVFERVRPIAARDIPISCTNPECYGYGERKLSTFNFQFSQFLQELSAGTII